MKIKSVNNSSNKFLARRASVKKYDPNHKIDRATMRNILEDATTAPSSVNLQPWRFIVVDTPEGKKSIQESMTFNQDQWETSSAIIVVLGDLENFNYIEQILDANINENLMSEEYKIKMMQVIGDYKKTLTLDEITKIVTLDCGLVSMQIMLSANTYGYDTNPIGGFLHKELCEALNIDTKRYIPALLISIGKANEEIKNSTRFSIDEITEWK